MSLHTFFLKLFPNDLHHSIGLHAEVRERMPVKGRVLDLGCGAHKDMARYRTVEREVWGADFQTHPNLEFAEWFRLLGPDGAIPFPDDTFDVVVANMVMEHVESPAAFLHEISRVLRPGGVFIGHTISGSHYVTWIRQLIGCAPHSFNQWLVRRLYGRLEVDTFPAYYRLNRTGQIEHACRETSLRVVGIQRYADPSYFVFSRVALASAIVADRMLASVVSEWGRLYLTVMLTKPDTQRPFDLLPLQQNAQPDEGERLSNVA